MIRVIVAVGQNRGRLRNAYNALRGRDPRTGEVNETQINHQLDLLKTAQATALNPTNWDDFLRVLGRAGFRSRKMITSNNTVLYTYSLWLIGLTKFNLDRSRLRGLMARWFFMSQTTGRYTNSPETSMEEDLARFDDNSREPEIFVNVIERVIETTLTGDFWTIRLPDDFITSSTFVSPAYQAYVASLNILDADLFLLNEKIRDWMDPICGSNALCRRPSSVPSRVSQDSRHYEHQAHQPGGKYCSDRLGDQQPYFRPATARVLAGPRSQAKSDRRRAQESTVLARAPQALGVDVL